MSEAQRARMLAAAARVLAERGFEQLSATRIIHSARVSRRTFYEVFEDREDCFLAVFEDALARTGERVLAAYGHGGGDWRERARAGLQTLLGFFDEEPALARLLVVHVLRGGPVVLARRAEVLALIAGEIQAQGEHARQGRDEISELTGEGVVGGVLGVLHTRLSAERPGRLLPLLSSLMAVIVLPYEGPAAAREELRRSVPEPVHPRAPRTTSERERDTQQGSVLGGPLAGVPMRLTYRTLCVLGAIADIPGASNREVGERAGTSDQGQISKLLTRLKRLGLIENSGAGQAKGERNAWTLTELGRRLIDELRLPRGSGDDDGAGRSPLGALAPRTDGRGGRSEREFVGGPSGGAGNQMTSLGGE